MERYEQVKPKPNPLQLSKLLNTCKGKRKMKQMSIDTGIFQSTLSRISNCSISQPLSIDIMKRIYEARDPECNVTFTDFITANGMIEMES